MFLRHCSMGKEKDSFSHRLRITFFFFGASLLLQCNNSGYFHSLINNRDSAELLRIVLEGLKCPACSLVDKWTPWYIFWNRFKNHLSLLNLSRQIRHSPLSILSCSRLISKPIPMETVFLKQERRCERNGPQKSKNRCWRSGLARSEIV